MNRRIQIGKPTCNPASRKLLLEAFDSQCLSEGEYTHQLEQELSKAYSKKAILVNSGHSALLVGLTATRLVYGYHRVATTALTFISTVSAALEAGYEVDCYDLEEDSLNVDLPIDLPPDSLRLPVALFGYPASITHCGTFLDACEAVGTKVYGVPHGSELGIETTALSFYTSHVLGGGELGVVLTSNPEIEKLVRSLKDQGRYHIRPSDHVTAPWVIDPEERYRHSRLGWNFRTTDLQAAVILGAWPSLYSVVLHRQANVKTLNELLENNHLILPKLCYNVSYLGYPILCDTPELRNKLLHGLDRAGIETRPLMSLIPEEEATRNQVSTPVGYARAKSCYDKGFYISCHESLSYDDLVYVSEQIQELM